MPFGVTHAVIDPSVNTVRRRAFAGRQHLVSVIFHDGVEIIEEYAFSNCESLRRLKLLGVREIGDRAFQKCVALTKAEFGDRLETVGESAFYGCDYLTRIKMPTVRITEQWAFQNCFRLTDVEFGENLERIGFHSFFNCPNLYRIAIPLKYNLLPFHRSIGYQRRPQFDQCKNLRTVDIVGAEEIHSTISSFLMESWRDEMNKEINRINRELANTDTKANRIQQWIRSVIDKMEHYKAEHNRYLKEHMVHLELAIWKAKLEDEEEDSTMKVHATKRVEIDEGSNREGKRITSGADIIIKNVLPFLKLA